MIMCFIANDINSICSLLFAVKRAEDSSSRSEAAHSSDTDVPLCIQELCSSLATEVCVFTFHKNNKLINYTLKLNFDFRLKSLKRRCGQIMQNSDVLCKALLFDILILPI